MSADGFAGGLTDGTEEYAARMGVDRFAPPDDREAQDVEALAGVLYADARAKRTDYPSERNAWSNLPDSFRDLYREHARTLLYVASDWLAARERAAAEKALRDAAHALPGFIDGIHAHGDAARWLRERADRLGDA